MVGMVGMPGWLPVYRVSDRYTQLVAGITVWQVYSVNDRYTEMLVATYPVSRIGEISKITVIKCY